MVSNILGRFTAKPYRPFKARQTGEHDASV